MNNEKLHDILVSTVTAMDSNLPRVKQPTNVIRKEYPYFKRLLRALLGKPTWYEVNEWISPVFNEPKGESIKVVMPKILLEPIDKYK